METSRIMSINSRYLTDSNREHGTMVRIRYLSKYNKLCSFGIEYQTL